jgi:hypothetical protein
MGLSCASAISSVLSIASTPEKNDGDPACDGQESFPFFVTYEHKPDKYEPNRQHPKVIVMICKWHGVWILP